MELGPCKLVVMDINIPFDAVKFSCCLGAPNYDVHVKRENGTSATFGWKRRTHALPH